MRDRRLWKRVFEVTAKDKDSGAAQLAQALKILDGLGVEYGVIQSSSALTNFRARRDNEASRNYLRLIRKDAAQFPRVVPIEDHSALINTAERVHISRIYVEETVARQVKQTLTERLSMT
jgi:hypothetical protein